MNEKVILALIEAMRFSLQHAETVATGEGATANYRLDACQAARTTVIGLLDDIITAIAAPNEADVTTATTAIGTACTTLCEDCCEE